MKLAVLTGLGLALCAGEAWAKEWKVYCLPERHLDVGWSFLPADAPGQAYAGSIEENHNFVLGQAMLMHRDFAHVLSPEARPRWFVDSAWQIEQLEKWDQAAFPVLRRLINSREFAYNPMYANLHTLQLGHEELMRTMAYGRLLERKGFRRSFLASASDAFSVGWGYASMLASAGIKYFVKGTWFKGPSVTPGLTLVEGGPLFRWVGPDGKKVLFFYYGGYHDMGGNYGEPLTEKVVLDAVQRYEQLGREGKWPYDAFPLFGSEGDFGIPDIDNSKFVHEWNKKRTDIRLVISTPEEFFEYIDGRFGDKIPSLTGGWGVSHDVEENTFAKPGARARANDHLLFAAEAWGALAADRYGRPYDADGFRDLWLKQVLYHEHSFGYMDSGPSPKSLRQYVWKNRLTEHVEETAQRRLDEALAAFAADIPGAGERGVAVFNSLPFESGGVVELPARQVGRAPETIRIVDVASGHEAVVEPKPDGSVRFLASSVPALGYRSYRIGNPDTASAARPAGGKGGVRADARARTIENQFYRLTLAPDGSISGLWDKDLGAELLDVRASFRGNQFVFKDDVWRDHSPASARIAVEDQGPLGATLRVEGAPSGIFPRLTMRYTLPVGGKRVDIVNSFTKEPGTTSSAETVFYAFPFAVPGGGFHMDIPGVVARYPEEFRKETQWTYMPAQSFVAASSERMNIVLATREAPNFAFRSMRRYFDHQPLPSIANTHVFAMPLSKQTVNRHDFDREGGTYTFSYALTSGRGPLQPAAALRFAWGFQRPLRAVALTGAAGGLPAAGGFVDIDALGVVMLAFKQADDGRGIVARLWNPGPKPQMARVALPGRAIAQALTTDSLERDLGGSYRVRNGRAEIGCAAREIVTVRLVPPAPRYRP